MYVEEHWFTHSDPQYDLWWPKREGLSEMRGRPARRFLGEMTLPRRLGESLLQFVVGILSQKITLRVSIVRLLKYEHQHYQYSFLTMKVLIFGFC